MIKNAFCTIIAKNYLPQAVVLIQSLRNFHPDDEFFLLVIDSEVQLSVDIANLSILTPDSLDLSQLDLQIMRTLYDVVEISTCLKPSLLEYIISLEFDSVTFLDPDIQVFAPLTLGIEVAMSKHIALTPHRITSSVEFDQIFLEYGIFNLGYICVSKKATNFLFWWKTKLLTNCTRVTDSHLFTDQKWINFIPVLFPYEIIKHPGYNVAPWNLDERELVMKANVTQVNNVNLVFIHYSQMSGQLAGGGLSREWRKKLEGLSITDESLNIFNDKLSSYTALLKDARRSELSLARFIPIKDAFSSRNRYFRLKLRNQLKSGSLTDLSMIPSKELPRDRIIGLLSRSAVFHALMIAFPIDRKKIHKRLKSD